ncbi:MAG: hypothetical protein JM58_07985 [Peptococcaceae bacterium BICA1-8]|nr:MAG: hypothetical protein JM58_07985 [Peptococcaceae bacterium BICA1-8]
MKSINLEITERNASLGRGALNKLRKQGVLPGIIYGTKIGNASVLMAKKDLINVLNSHGHNAIITLNIKGQTIQAMIKEIQRHPVTGHYWHIDFGEISMHKKIRTEIQIHFEGEPEGVKDGGIVQHNDTAVEIECLPHDIPERVILDVSSLKIGDKLTVADIMVGENVQILSEPEKLLVAVIQPTMDNEEEEDQEANEETKAEETP